MRYRTQLLVFTHAMPIYEGFALPYVNIRGIYVTSRNFSDQQQIHLCCANLRGICVATTNLSTFSGPMRSITYRKTRVSGNPVKQDLAFFD